jgi:hypothetical protein
MSGSDVDDAVHVKGLATRGYGEPRERTRHLAAVAARSIARSGCGVLRRRNPVTSPARARVAGNVGPRRHDARRIPEPRTVASDHGARVPIPGGGRGSIERAPRQRNLHDSIEVHRRENGSGNGVAGGASDRRGERRIAMRVVRSAARPGVITPSVAGSATAGSISQIHATIQMQRAWGERRACCIGFVMALRARTGKMVRRRRRVAIAAFHFRRFVPGRPCPRTAHWPVARS